MNTGTLLRRRRLPSLIPSGFGRRWGRPSPRVLAIVAAVIVLLGGGWLWLRDSSLVSIRQVTVVGASGQDAGKIRHALIVAAHAMTTLDVNISALQRAVAPYPEVKSIHVSTSFPHGLRIFVVEQYPIAVVSVGGSQTEVASDGTLLHQVSGAGSLPSIPLSVPPGGSRLTERPALDAIAVLVAGPWQFISRISQASENPQHGVVLQLRSGPAVYFGDTSRLALKWRALLTVLADLGSAGATYIDVSDPLRPAAGGGAAAAQAALAAGLAQTGTTSSQSTTPSSATGAGTSTGSAAGTSTGTGTSTGAQTGSSTSATSTGTATGQAATSTSTAGGSTGTTAAPTGGAAGG
ncbi:MAG: cell division protein FtsQ/DivIB [Solirubrobacteraceae bacterium]